MLNGRNILRTGACVVVLAGLVAGCNREHREKEGKEGHGRIRTACMADIEKYCGNYEKRREQRECLERNQAKLSDACKAALAERAEKHKGRDRKDGDRKDGDDD